MKETFLAYVGNDISEHDLEQALIAELLLTTVFRLSQSIGIDKQRTSLDGVNFLTLILQVRP